MALSEAKIVIGRYDEYVTLPVTVLATLDSLKMSFGERKVSLRWSKECADKEGTVSHLLLDKRAAREPVDGLFLYRTTDKTGITTLWHGK